MRSESSGTALVFALDADHAAAQHGQQQSAHHREKVHIADKIKAAQHFSVPPFRLLLS